MGWVKVSLFAAAAIVVSGAALVVGEVLWAQASRGLGVAPEPPIPAGVRAGGVGLPTATVVWLGDSTAAGVGGSSAASGVSEQTAALLGSPVTLTVLAQSGARLADVLHRQLPNLAALQPNVVFLSIGANDVTHLTPRGDFRREYQAVLAGMPHTVSLIVLLGVPDMGAPTRLPQPLRAIAGWRGRMLDADVRHLAARTPKAVYVDIAGRTGPPFRRNPRRYFAADHYHPDDAGYALWAQAVADTLRSDHRWLAPELLDGPPVSSG